MSSPPAATQDAASALAQAIGTILRAMLDALFGDISGLAPRHPIRRAHARTLRHIERYVTSLAAALSTPGEAPCEETSLTVETGPGALMPAAVLLPRSAPSLSVGSHPHAGSRRWAPSPRPARSQAPPSLPHAHFVPI